MRPGGQQLTPDQRRRRRLAHTGKQRYGSEAQARAVAVNHAGMDAYKCSWCPAWHVGHDRRDGAVTTLRRGNETVRL